MQDTIQEMFRVIENRKKEPQEGSYTCYLFEKGVDKILKKCGEECSEMIIAAKNLDLTPSSPEAKEEFAGEIADLVYHVLVLMQERGVPLSAVEDILKERSKKIGNLKTFHQVDRQS